MRRRRRRPGSEACNGLDDDCDGTADENWADLGEACNSRSAPAPARGPSAATPPRRAARRWPGCRRPSSAASDDDTDGGVDEALAGRPLSRSCYDGPEGTEGVAACGGRSAAWRGLRRLEGQVLPGIEVCNGEDDDCDGRVDRTPAGDRLTQACYGGPEGTAGQGPCVAGVAECRFGQFEACVGEVLPAAEICDLADNDCNGQIDERGGRLRLPARGARELLPPVPRDRRQGICRAGRQTACPTGQASPPAMGPCCPGRRPATASMMTATARWMTPSSASASPAPTAWAPGLARGATTCNGSEILCDAVASPPGVERCDSLDNDCDGRTDEGFAPGPGLRGGRAPAAPRARHPAAPMAPWRVPPRPARRGQSSARPRRRLRRPRRRTWPTSATAPPAARASAARPARLPGGAEICTARAQAAAEQCDGLDNDCDGATDESQGQVPCGVGSAGHPGLRGRRAGGL
ncbi:MAG: MopE-related protein [bacterium]